MTESQVTIKGDKMTLKRGIYSFLGIAVLCAPALLAQQVKTDYDRNPDFSRYKTYSWGNVHTQDPLWVDRIKGAVNSLLAARGWTQPESAGATPIMPLEMTTEHRTDTRPSA